jgi:hypothetical protein
MLQFSIVQESLKITNGTSTILLIAKKDISINALSLQGATPRAELYNIQLGYTGVVFLHPLSDCEDDLGNPFTVNSFIAFAENNFGFSDSGSGSATFSNDYLASDWVLNTLTVIHNLGSLTPKVVAYDFGELVIFGISIIDDNSLSLLKNIGNPAPALLSVGVSK